MSDLIKPRTLSGFRDFLPEAMIPREQMIATVQKVYRSFGFAPIETPTLEYLEILAGKGSEETDRQMYRFTDHGGRDVGMRFDLTVPLARFAAQHIGELGTPFKRYHIATVWRGERKQRFRYREFMQCDFDTIGSSSVNADTETALVIHELMHTLGIHDFAIRLNNRKVLNGLLEKLSLEDSSVPVLRALDKLGKIGVDGVLQELVSVAGTTDEQAKQVIELTNLSGETDEILSRLSQLLSGNDLGTLGVSELEAVVKGLSAAGIEDRHVRLDVSIARGLDYYTGTIFETFLDQLPEAGSVCSGGRYDNLAELYSKQTLPGIGASLGLDRLLSVMEDLGLIETTRAPAPVLLVNFDQNRIGDYLSMATKLRRAGLGVELYPEAKKIGQQLKYADRKGFRCAIVAGEDEFQAGIVQLKNLTSGDSQEIAVTDDLASLQSAIRQLLSERAQ